MLEVPSTEEAIRAGRYAAGLASVDIPRFDIKQPSLSKAIGRGGNCLAIAKHVHRSLTEQKIVHFFQYQFNFIRMRGIFPHCQLIIPTDSEDNWGVIVDANGILSDEHDLAFLRPSLATAKDRDKHLVGLEAGDIVPLTDDFGGHLKRPINMRTLQYDLGLEQYVQLHPPAVAE